MSMIHGARREIHRLRARMAQEDREFRAEAPPLDEDGLPNWDGSEPLSVESYRKAMGVSPDEELSDAELETRKRLSPYHALFQRMGREKAEEKGEPVR